MEEISANGTSHSLFSPRNERWKPLRSGILNLYRFDYEEFHYEEGRLLLRGNNATGKSRVLALQLPFLLDGEVNPRRLEPDGDEAKKVDWNLLMGKYPDRTGYSFLELRRRDAEGKEHFCTLGCGLSAVEGKGLNGKWFFVTSLRVGRGVERDFSLQSEHGVPLSRDRLREALGEHGEVFTTATAYRQAVDRALFRLGESRYQALVDLLIQLRQPQLSRSLDEKKLSAALSEALPPLKPAILSEVAESFRSLEDDRIALDGYVAAHEAVQKYLGDYRRYLRIETRRRAEKVRSTHSAYEATQRRLLAAKTEYEKALSDIESLGLRNEELVTAEREAETAERVLLQRPEMQDARALELARRNAEDRRQDEEQSASGLKQAAHAALERKKECAETKERYERKEQESAEKLLSARSKAEESGFLAAHTTVFDAVQLDLLTKETIGNGRKALQERINKRSAEIRHLLELSRKVEAAETALRFVKQQLAELSVQCDNLTELHRQTVESFGREKDGYLLAFREWSRSLKELAVSSLDDLEEQLQLWCESLAGENPLAAAVTSALECKLQELAALRAQVEQALRANSEKTDVLQTEYDRLAAGTLRLPPQPYTRDEDARKEKRGAPLWLLCEFRSEVPEAVRAGVEAALEASGLLDAWVSPEGALWDRELHDIILLPQAEGRAPHRENYLGENHLGRILEPAIDRDHPRYSSVAEETVRSILARVGVGETGDVWVDESGAWRVGPLGGSWMKSTAEYIGEGARERSRKKRMSEIVQEIALLTAEEAELWQREREVSAREADTKREASALPPEAPLHSAGAKVEAAYGSLIEVRWRLAEREKEVGERRAALEGAESARDSAAGDLGLLPFVKDLARLEARFADYREGIAPLWPTLESFLHHRTEFARAESLFRTAKAHHEECENRQREASRCAREATVEYETLTAAVGKAVAEIERALKLAGAEVRRVKEELEKVRSTRTEAEIARGVSENKTRTETEALAENFERRSEAVEALTALRQIRLLAIVHEEFVATDETEWPVSRSVEVARKIETLLGEVQSNDAALERSEKELLQHYQTLQEALLPHELRPYGTREHGIFVVTVPFRGKSCSVLELQSGVWDEIVHHRTLLNAREKEILENHLIGEVSAHLHERLHECEILMHEMNHEIGGRPMSTGMKLRFVWEPVPDAPQGFHEIRKKLLRAEATWSKDDRELLGAFLQKRIETVREEQHGGTWQEHLTLAFDYRSWHQFAIDREQDGQWKRLTKRTHGTGSGGEKAIALTLIQFAAAAAHYRSADPFAPRFILLDEAFVGVDSDMRSKCMGLLHAFDLDFLMTSEREWGCYATLPGVAICQLAARAGIDAVAVTRWVWNGRERVEVSNSQ